MDNTNNIEIFKLKNSIKNFKFCNYVGLFAISIPVLFAFIILSLTAFFERGNGYLIIIIFLILYFLYMLNGLIWMIKGEEQLFFDKENNEFHFFRKGVCKFWKISSSITEFSYAFKGVDKNWEFVSGNIANPSYGFAGGSIMLNFSNKKVNVGSLANQEGLKLVYNNMNSNLPKLIKNQQKTP